MKKRLNWVAFFMSVTPIELERCYSRKQFAR